MFLSFFLRKRLQRLENRLLNPKIITPAPNSGSDENDWKWYNKEVAYNGKPFLFKLGPYTMKVEQLTKDGLEKLIGAKDVYDAFSELFLPVCKFGKLSSLFRTARDRKKTLFTKVPASALSGLINEFIAYCTSVKKKMLDTNRIVSSKGPAEQSINSVKKQALERLRVSHQSGR
jgi:hypothetical protein